MKIHKCPQWALSRLEQSIPLYHSDNMRWKAADHPLVFIGGVHGDEPEGVALAEMTLDWLEEDAKKPRPQVEMPWVLIPCLNVDGYAKEQRVNGAGVDLNRNYPSRDWVAEQRADRYNPGPGPGSEPEIQALVKLIEQVSPRILIHAHSWKPCIVCAGEGGMTDARRLGESSGYEVREDIGYPTPGSLSQYAWADLGIPVICIEEAEKAGRALIWKHFGKAIEQIFSDPSDRRAIIEG